MIEKERPSRLVPEGSAGRRPRRRNTWWACTTAGRGRGAARKMISKGLRGCRWPPTLARRMRRPRWPTICSATSPTGFVGKAQDLLDKAAAAGHRDGKFYLAGAAGNGAGRCAARSETRARLLAQVKDELDFDPTFFEMRAAAHAHARRLRAGAEGSEARAAEGEEIRVEYPRICRRASRVTQASKPWTGNLFALSSAPFASKWGLSPLTGAFEREARERPAPAITRVRQRFERAERLRGFALREAEA